MCLLGEGMQLLLLRVGGDKKLPSVSASCHSLPQSAKSDYPPGKQSVKGQKELSPHEAEQPCKAA